MRHVIAAILMASAFGSMACTADEPKPVATKPAEPKAEAKPALGIGDKAPPLKVTKWVQGEEIKEFAAGKVYVVEFWATWCGPCIQAMPHLVELQEEFKKDLVVIGLTSKDERGNTKEKVEAFVAKNKDKFTYRFAFCDDRDTDKAYMEAAQQDGIPCSFVVDKSGKIAYIGHPMELDLVLPKVIDGTWKGKADVDAIAKANETLDKINEAANPEPTKEMPKGSPQLIEAEKRAAEAALPKLAEFEKANPIKAGQDMFNIQKMVLMMKAKKYDDAKVVGEAMLAKSAAKKKVLPGNYTGMILASKELNPDKKFLDLATKSLDTVLAFEPKDVGLLLASIELQMFIGDKAKAAEYGKKAVEASDEKDKKEVEKIVEMLLKGTEK